MIKSTILEFLSDFYILCMRGAKAKFTFRALNGHIGGFCRFVNPIGKKSVLISKVMRMDMQMICEYAARTVQKLA